jgi:hypothetical protein
MPEIGIEVPLTELYSDIELTEAAENNAST